MTDEKEKIEEAIKWLQKYRDGVSIEYQRWVTTWTEVSSLEKFAEAVFYNWDFREKPEPVVKVRYQNVYDAGVHMSSSYETILEANTYAVEGRIAIVKTTTTIHPDGKREFEIEEVRL